MAAMQIFVKAMTGKTTVLYGVRAAQIKTITLDVEASDTIDGFPPGQQRRSFCGATI